jgi:hypothetical protein
LILFERMLGESQAGKTAAGRMTLEDHVRESAATLFARPNQA